MSSAMTSFDLNSTLLVVNLVLSLVSTIMLGVNFRMKCCCGELNITPKDDKQAATTDKIPPV